MSAEVEECGAVIISGRAWQTRDVSPRRDAKATFVVTDLQMHSEVSNAREYQMISNAVNDADPCGFPGESAAPTCPCYPRAHSRAACSTMP